MVGVTTEPAEPVPPLDLDRADLVHVVLGEIPEHLHKVVGTLLELPPDHEVTHGIEVRDLVVPICAGRLDPDVVWRALVALDLVRPGFTDGP